MSVVIERFNFSPKIYKIPFGNSTAILHDEPQWISKKEDVGVSWYM